jgi:hypothetical protein
MSEFLRLPTHHYQDPLSRVWLACAEQLGFRVRRTGDAYASTDGRGTILLAVDALFDADDCLAQMILHELCHALVEGDEGESRVDWGLGQAGGGNPWREHACLRLQAYLAGSVGLRKFFAPTTDYRLSFWNGLGDDPFCASSDSGGRRERSCVAGRLAAWRASLPRWDAPLQRALKASAAIAAAMPNVVQSEPCSTAPESNALPSLWMLVETPPTLHPSGHAPIAAYHGDQTCAGCAWGFLQRQQLRCRHAPSVKLDSDTPACTRFEPTAELDCLSCGACCREAYHAVEISTREPVNRLHPELVVTEATHRKLRREGERCAALLGGQTPVEPYTCAIYASRPKTCREFTLGSENCLDARRRVGLSL